MVGHRILWCKGEFSGILDIVRRKKRKFLRFVVTMLLFAGDGMLQGAFSNFSCPRERSRENPPVDTHLTQFAAKGHSTCQTMSVQKWTPIAATNPSFI